MALQRGSKAISAAHRQGLHMGYTAQILDDIRAQLAPEDAAIKEARQRRESVRSAALVFRGSRHTFASGSLAHATANCPVHLRDKGLDADCGVVLDRRSYPSLGPDSVIGDGPNDVVEQVRSFVQGRVIAAYPKVRVTTTKRALLLEFNEPLPNGEDPTVDLVVGLERSGARGLWIPNTEANRWDPSDPEEHTRLLTSEPKSLRVTRARAIRLAKAENKRAVDPLLCSFNLEALALMFVTQGMSVPDALVALWRDGARDLRTRLTPDPAGVSAPIKCGNRTVAADRLDSAADRLVSAMAHDDDESWVRRELAALWPEFVADSGVGVTKARALARLKSGASLSVTRTGSLSATAGLALKEPRSFGESH